MANTTVSGYINRNRQKNVGETGEPGTDHMQQLYLMKCLDCGYEYKANGSDIWQRKCPKCQHGKP
jgi:predicted Zn-ribbon and HTH transcriptional regulator